MLFSCLFLVSFLFLSARIACFLHNQKRCHVWAFSFSSASFSPLAAYPCSVALRDLLLRSALAMERLDSAIHSSCCAYFFGARLVPLVTSPTACFPMLLLKMGRFKMRVFSFLFFSFLFIFSSFFERYRCCSFSVSASSVSWG
ncbi:hypothetical protein LI328DRAFT_45568 [Trichoderma asperelloides]|nr:hypothetical protein LI328DRAFT_45568 [Trichoderma asperelloides]